MFSITRSLLLTLSALTAFSVHAVSFDPVDPNNQLDSIIELPIEGLRAVEANGAIYFVSQNGRFVFRGELFDVLYKKPLDTVSQLKDVSSRIHFAEMKADLDDYNTLSYGEGSRVAVVFVDPLCTSCHKLMADIRAQGLADQYTFKFVVVPALGEQSNVLSRQVFCAKEASKALDAFLNMDIDSLAQKAECNTRNYDKTLLMSHLLNIQGVPFLVAPDGRIHNGSPSNIKAWLEGQS